MADRSLQWRVLPLRKKSVAGDGSGSGLIEWYLLVTPLIAAIDGSTKLIVDDKCNAQTAPDAALRTAAHAHAVCAAAVRVDLQTIWSF
jgi:hypothetical protein